MTASAQPEDPQLRRELERFYAQHDRLLNAGQDTAVLKLYHPGFVAVDKQGKRTDYAQVKRQFAAMRANVRGARSKTVVKHVRRRGRTRRWRGPRRRSAGRRSEAGDGCRSRARSASPRRSSGRRAAGGPSALRTCPPTNLGASAPGAKGVTHWRSERRGSLSRRNSVTAEVSRMRLKLMMSLLLNMMALAAFGQPEDARLRRELRDFYCWIA